MDDPYYSHGVRQTLFMLFRNRTDFRLIQTDRRPGIDCVGAACDRQPEEENIANFRQGFENATFCIVATGAGWSQRAKMAVLHGCIPIVFADHVQVLAFSFPRGGRQPALLINNKICYESNVLIYFYSFRNFIYCFRS